MFKGLNESRRERRFATRNRTYGRDTIRINGKSGEVLRELIAAIKSKAGLKKRTLGHVQLRNLGL